MALQLWPLQLATLVVSIAPASGSELLEWYNTDESFCSCCNEKDLYKFNCSLSLLYLSFYDARDVTPFVHAPYTLHFNYKYTECSIIKCSDSASKHHLVSLPLLFSSFSFFFLINYLQATNAIPAPPCQRKQTSASRN